MIDRDAHRLSLEYLHGNIPLSKPELYPLPRANTPEAYTLNSQLKPERYARLAIAIGHVVDYSLSQIPERPPLGLLPNYYVDRDDPPFDQAKSRFLWTLIPDMRSQLGHPALQPAHDIVALTHRLDAQRFHTVNAQLRAGYVTAANTMFELLEGMPSMVKAKGFEASPTELERIARHSLRMPTAIARLCINRFMGARDQLRAEIYQGNYSAVQAVTNDAELKALHFVDLESLILTDDFEALDHSGLTYPAGTRVSDIECYEMPIGCPITLLQGHLGKLWNWSIDITVGLKLWDTTT